jgi:hypothetical protein
MDVSPERRRIYEEITGKAPAASLGQTEEGYRFRGLVKGRETAMRLQELRMRELEMQVPIVFPFRDRHAILQGRIEAQGRDPDNLYLPYEALIESILAPSESPSLAVPIEQEAPGTLALMGLFQHSDREGVEAFVEERLKANERDLPALLVRLDVAISDAAVESVFDTLEQLVDAVAEREPKIVDSDALYYYLLLIGSKYARLTEDALEGFLESSVKGYDLQLVSKPILHALERDGEW